MTGPAKDSSLDPDVAEVRKKADRVVHARRNRRTVLSHLGSAGILGWVFILPVVGMTLLAKILADYLERPWIALLGTLVGVLIGGVAAYVNVRRSLGSPEKETEE